MPGCLANGFQDERSPISCIYELSMRLLTSVSCFVGDQSCIRMPCEARYGRQSSMAAITPFVSDDHADTVCAFNLAQALQPHPETGSYLPDFDCWIDDNSIGAGSNWRQAIEDAIQACAVFVLIAGKIAGDLRRYFEETTDEPVGARHITNSSQSHHGLGHGGVSASRPIEPGPRTTILDYATPAEVSFHSFSKGAGFTFTTTSPVF